MEIGPIKDEIDIRRCKSAATGIATKDDALSQVSELIDEMRAKSPAERRVAILRGDEPLRDSLAIALDALQRGEPQYASDTFAVSLPRTAQEPWWWEHKDKFHPATLGFPIDRARVEQLAQDLAADNRLHEHPIIRHPDGRILLGRERYLAARMANIEPKYGEDWNGEPGTELAAVMADNFNRRHLTVSQKSLIAAEYARTLVAEGKARGLAQLKRGDVQPGAVPAALGRSTEIAAKQCDVSPRSVSYASLVIEDCAPEVVDQVRDGALSLADALVLGAMPLDFQTNTVNGGADTIRATVRDLKKERTELRNRIKPGVVRQATLSGAFDATDVVKAAALERDPDKAIEIIAAIANPHAARIRRLRKWMAAVQKRLPEARKTDFSYVSDLDGFISELEGLIADSQRLLAVVSANSKPVVIVPPPQTLLLAAMPDNPRT